MLIYNVTVKVESLAKNEWLDWMKDEHLKEVMQTGCFSDYRLCELLDQDNADGDTFIVQYFCDGQAQYQKYLDNYADQMRQKGLDRFGNKFIAFRTLMKRIN